MSYLILLLTAISRLINVLLGGSIHETLSSRVGYAAIYGDWRWRLARRVINGLFFWQDDHCAAAIEWDDELNERR